MRRPRGVALTGMARALSTRSVLLAVSVLCAGVAGGFLFRLLHLPLPWTLGAMFSAAWLSFFRPAAVLPAVFRDGARPVIGVMAGSAFTPAIVAGMTGQWPVLLLLADVLGRVVAPPGELAAGLVTAAVGAPVLIAIARRRRVGGA